MTAAGVGATRVAPTPAAVNAPLRGPVHRRIPEGDTRERLVCDDCGFILYSNPLIVAGAIVRVGGDGILLARRNIAPRVGCWGLPVGFMECGESVPAGAAREVLEETDAVVRIGSLACLYSVPRASQVHMYFRADVDAAHVPSTTHFLGTPLAPGEVNGTCYGSGHETMEVCVCVCVCAVCTGGGVARRGHNVHVVVSLFCAEERTPRCASHAPDGAGADARVSSA
ncbi:NUDIX hydrolase [archaeon]|nr:MAG: NUDIX hydrolase [archaeon]